MKIKSELTSHSDNIYTMNLRKEIKKINSEHGLTASYSDSGNM